MGEINILHAPESRGFSCSMAAALAAEGHAVRRVESDTDSADVDRPPADAVIIVWSPALKDSPAMLAAAREGLARRVLVPVALGDIEPPRSFADLWPIDLAGWGGDVDDPRWQFVRDEVELAARRNERPKLVGFDTEAPAPAPKRSLPKLTAPKLSTPSIAAPRAARLWMLLPAAAGLALLTGAGLWAASLGGGNLGGDNLGGGGENAPAILAMADSSETLEREPVRLETPEAERMAAESAQTPPAADPAASDSAAQSAPPDASPDPAPKPASQTVAAIDTPSTPKGAALEKVAKSETPPATPDARKDDSTARDDEGEIAAQIISAEDAYPPPLPPRAEDNYAGVVFRDCLSCPDMAEIPGGSFRAGTNDAAAPGIATIDRPFAMARREVTFKEWRACADEGACRAHPADAGWGRDDRPVINVSWRDAQDYIAWLSMKTGRDYRLPSDAEWTYAAQARDEALSPMRANYDAGPEGRRAMTVPAASFAPSVFGLYDMLGNVWEWTADCLEDDQTVAALNIALREPSESAACARRIVKGGAYDTEAADLSPARRAAMPETARAPNSGFRVARALP